MSTAKPARKGTYESTVAAALAVKNPEPEGSPWGGESTKAISVRLPVSLYKRVTTHSLKLRLARGAEKKKDREASDPLSMHGLMLTALAQYLDREGVPAIED